MSNNQANEAVTIRKNILRNLFKQDDSANGATLLPIRLTMLYLTISVLVYAFGPFDWTTSKPVLMYTLIVMYMIALWLGYRIGVKKSFPKAIKWSTGSLDKLMSVLSILIVVNYCVYVVNIFRDYGLQTFNFPELFRQMAIGIKDPGLGYHYRCLRVESLQGNQVIGGTMFTLFNYIWSFFRYPILLMSMLSFRKLKVWGKLFAVVYLATMLLFYLSIGTTIDVLHVFLLLILPAVLNTFKVWYKREIKVKHVIKLGIVLVMSAALVLSYFTWMMLSRGGINYYDTPSYNVGGVYLRKDDTPDDKEPVVTAVPAEEVVVTAAPVEEVVVTAAPVEEVVVTAVPAEEVVVTAASVEEVAITAVPTEEAVVTAAPTEEAPHATVPMEKKGFQVPPIIMKFWISFSSYFTQGYYGMAQALELPWTPMFGVGSSMFAVDFISGNVYDIDQFTYQKKVELATGWDADMRWNCMYTWLANDVSFYGVAIVMLLLGILFGTMFKDAIATENPFAKMSVFYFVLMVLFIPCNNQIAQRSDTLFSFALIVFCWLVSKYPPRFLKKILSK